MYEFLAPWGVIAPAACAIFAYYKLGPIWRKHMQKKDGLPRDLGV
jgi:hypothetical protein